jgi:hypothetical protein
MVEDVPKYLIVSEAAPAVLAENRMIMHLIYKVDATEPSY